MVKLVTLSLQTLRKVLSWITKHKRLAIELILASLLALSVHYGTTVSTQNKKLSESLELAQNNIEAIQTDNGVLKLKIEDLKNNKDILTNKIDSVRKELNIKSSHLSTAATQTQHILVKGSKGVRGDIIEILKDTIYTDSINYNDLTKVYYSIGKDSVNINLDIQNTQYLYTYKTRQYKNKKNFFKRLFTFDFKKVDKYQYKIINTNDLLKESDIRIIEIK